MMSKSVVLPVSQRTAFELFTGRVDEWWPPGHRLTRDETATILMQASGRFYERAGDGREVELGRVRDWDMPRRLLLDFYPGSGPGQPTEVEVLFEPRGDMTEVTVIHRPKPESAHLWGRTAPRYDGSWTIILPRLLFLAG